MERFFNILTKWNQVIFEFVFPRNKSEVTLAGLSASQFKERVTKSDNKDGEINSLFSYRDSLVKDLIWLIKYKKRDFAIKLAAEILLDEAFEEASEQMAFSGGRKTLLIPIPVSPHRFSERGYNQMNEIGKVMMQIGGEGCFEYAPNVLVKIKDTKSQTSIRNRSDRLKNVVGCFSISNKEKIKGRNILVVDDVTTTGATLLEARKILQKAGAHKIELLAIAH